MSDSETPETVPQETTDDANPPAVVSDEEQLLPPEDSHLEGMPSAADPWPEPIPDAAFSPPEDMAGLEFEEIEAEVAGFAMADAPEPIMSDPTVIAIRPEDIDVHPLAEMLPLASAVEDERLEAAMAMDGQRVPGIRFEGKLLDGRRRRRICEKLGIPLRIRDLGPEDPDPLTYVFDVNLYQRPLSAAQKAAVAAKAKPQWATYVNEQRIEKLKQTLAENDANECPQALGDTALEQDRRNYETDRILAKKVGVNHTYVSYASRLLKENPELFEQVWRGELSLEKAMRRLRGEVDSEREKRAAITHRQVGRMLKNTEKCPGFLDALVALVEQYATPQM